MKQAFNSKFRIYYIGILIVFIATFISRSFALPYFLPYYSIDENEIVEFAVAYLCGDWDPHWYKYGPLYSYCLAFIYFIFSFFSEGTLDEYIQDIFFNPTKFYLTARIVNVILNLLLAYFTYKLAYHVFSNQRRATIALLIAIFPFFDILTGFKPRVDTLLALFVILSLTQLVLLYKTNKFRHYLLLGLFVGFSLASKPLPALLITPIILVAILLSVLREKGLLTYWYKNRIIGPLTDGWNRTQFFQSSIRSFFNYKFVGLVQSAFVGNFLANPFSILKLKSYLIDQKKAFLTEGSRHFVPGWDITRFFDNVGVVFVVVGLIAILFWTYSSIRKRKYENLILIVYAVIFWLAFSSGAARDYFYVPIFPVIIISISYLISELSLKFNRSSRPYIALAGAFALFLQPLFNQVRRDYDLIFEKTAYDKHTLPTSFNFIEDSLNTNNKFLLIGPSPELPRVVFKDLDLYVGMERNGRKSDLFGDYFMYGRGNNVNWAKLFGRAHSEEVTNSHFSLKNGEFYKGKLSPFIIYQNIERDSFNYIVTCYNYLEHAYLENQSLRKFDDSEYPYGNPVFIYQTKKGYDFQNPKSADDHFILGTIARKNGNTELAEVHFIKSMDKDSTESRIYYELGTIKYNKGDYQEAYHFYEIGSRLDTSSFDMVFNKGLCLMKMQQYQTAVKLFDEAEKIDQEIVQLYLMRGLSYCGLGRRDLGCADFMTASEIDRDLASDYIKLYCMTR